MLPAACMEAAASRPKLMQRHTSDTRRTVKKVSLAIFLFLAGFGMLAGGIYLWYTSPGQGKCEPLLSALPSCNHWPWPGPTTCIPTC